MSRAATSLLFLGQLTFALIMLAAFTLFTLGIVIPYALRMSGGLLWLLAAGWCIFLVIGQIGAIFRSAGLALALIIPWWLLYFFFLGPWFMDRAHSFTAWSWLIGGAALSLAFFAGAALLRLALWGYRIIRIAQHES